MSREGKTRFLDSSFEAERNDSGLICSRDSAGEPRGKFRSEYFLLPTCPAEDSICRRGRLRPLLS